MTAVEVTPSRLELTLLDLADCVCTELTAIHPLCWCGVGPGAEGSWEYCGECPDSSCGMGWVRLATVFPYDFFPQPVIDDRCTKPLAAAIEVGALRCLPQPADGSILDPG